ncbi:hypothetical protein, partial [Vibrio cholerae]|uniref:hypothetical protein n=1 Tax=Vibrio cholerae TaxID=666 RepID=UPI0018F0F04F
QPIYYDAYGNMYYYTPQQQEAVAAAAASYDESAAAAVPQPQPPAFRDPLDRRPRAVASFGFGGQLVTMFPYQQQRFDSASQAVVTATVPGPI